MVETISSLDTIKGQGIEIPSEWKWGQLYGKQMQAGFKNTVTRSISGSASNFLSQLSGLLVIWAGAVLVLQGKLTIGQLIAFKFYLGTLLDQYLGWQLCGKTFKRRHYLLREFLTLLITLKK